ncbi:MAG: penicillin-binding transpeptidase domain-containing protein [Oscillospiraceae bacterium]
MDKLIKPARLALLGLILVVLILIYVLTLYKLQIIDGQAYYEESRNNIVTTETVSAARGSLLDRYGRVLVENKTCNNLVINVDELFPDNKAETIQEANATILQVCRLLEEYGDSHTDTLPITKTPPYEYTEMTDVQRTTLNAYLKDKGLPETTTAVELMAYMRDRYKIDDSYTAQEMRTIAGVRYEVNSRYSAGFSTSPYVFAEDVSMDLIATLMENDIKGFEVEQSFVREYKTSSAAHILGYIGMMTAEELEKYSDQDYKMDALVGKDGAEYAFEQYLHGVDGEARVTSTASGVVTSTVYTKEPEPGNNVYLTIDIGLQEAAENALNAFITAKNAEREASNAELDKYGGAEEDYQKLITGGGVAVVDVHTGEPLAIASWPSYDLGELMENFSENYSALLERENDPLFNRALQGAYAPGSTFKPCVAIAGLNEGKIDLSTTIECEGIFTKYADAGYAPKCWIYGQGLHGTLTLQEALTVSCNYYFYTVADYLQISLMAKYAKLFGLGEATGIELGENLGQMSTDQYTQALYGRDMYAGDTLAAGIGQAFSLFTPMQMAEYCAALANNGHRYSASILKSVRSYDFSETIYERQAEELSTVDTREEYFQAVREGMRGVVNDPVAGSVYAVFADAPYSLAAKTGTAQTGAENESENNGFFICFAPYDDPQIAIAIAIEKAGSGSSVAPIAREILDYYFSFMDSSVALESDGALLP